MFITNEDVYEGDIKGDEENKTLSKGYWLLTMRRH